MNLQVIFRRGRKREKWQRSLRKRRHRLWRKGSAATMRQIGKEPAVALCGDWFTAHGIGENLGYVKAECNEEIMSKVRVAFAEWYGNGHTNEDDPNTCLLRIRLTDGVLFHHGTRYDIDFQE